MRMLLKVRVPVDRGTAAINDGTLPRLIEQVMRGHEPEAAYFGVEDGMRTGFLVVDIADPSELPVIAEPFFQGLGASIDMSPVMTAEDLQRGLAAQQSATSAGNGAR